MSESMSEAKAKREAKNRDGRECRFCGMDSDEHNQEYGRGLHAHHIVKSGDGGIDHPRNLITVCRDCHNTLENTQADALSRIHNERIEEAKEEIEADYELKISRLQKKLDKAITAIHGLSRRGVDVESLSQTIQQHCVDFESVTTQIGTKAYVSTSHEHIEEAYEDWGSAMKKHRIHIPEESAEELAKDLQTEIQTLREELR